MPPKKKERPITPPLGEGKAEPLTAMERELYIIQVRDLEGRVSRYQRRLDELEVTKTDSDEKHEQFSKDLQDVIAYLKKGLNQRIDEIADLNDKVDDLVQAKENEKQSYESQLSQLRQDFQETKDQLTSENMILAGKLDALEEFRVQKEELMAKFAALEQQLKQQEEEHSDIIYNLERRAVVDKDRLKKEMITRVNAVAAEFRRISKKQVAETTRRAIRENVSISNQLGKMSDKSMKIIKENDELKMEAMKQWRNINILEESQKELVRKNLSNLKIIQMLTEKCKQQQKSLEGCMQREKMVQQLELTIKDLEAQNESLRNEVTSLKKELETKQSHLENQKASMEQQEKRRKQVEKVLSDAAYALKDALLDNTECADESSPTISVDKTDSEMAAYTHRSQMMQKLLLLLNNAAVLGLGPSPVEFINSELPIIEHKPGNIAERHGSASSAVKGSGLLSHYKVGDLGLVPRPKQVTPNLADKVGQLSKTTRLGLLRPFSRSAPTQMSCLLKDSATEDQGVQNSILPKITAAYCLQDQVCKPTS
ncbi:cilia- and flagella-associated protein 157 [Pristis pectinata]|uniref:cilia- and flagella-associated protein 157 n=1 Tax=Pristis pectinata TaxID=685728 RepID=UPI00223D630D|nr:cilia- and flagella-associated protein 157 [Pristis pectinata]